MSNIDIIKEVTNAFLQNRHDLEILDKYFALDFERIASGQRSNLKGYAAHLADYMSNYVSLNIAAWDELFTADDKVVCAYTFEGKRRDGMQERLAVIAIWRIRDGKIVGLREVGAPL
jgi:ketosteroid isomerase-like protein